MEITRTIKFYKIEVYNRNIGTLVETKEAVKFIKNRLKERFKDNNLILNSPEYQDHVIEVMEEGEDRVYLKLGNMNNTVPVEKRNRVNFQNSDIDLGDDEVLSPYTIMMIDFETMVASIVSSYGTPTITIFPSIMQYTTSHNSAYSIRIYMILTPEVFEKLQRKENIYSVEVAIARPAATQYTQSNFKISERSVHRLMRGNADLTTTFRFKYGGRNGMSVTKSIMDDISAVISDNQEVTNQLAACKVTTNKNDEGGREIINLLKDRLTVKTTIIINEGTQFLNFKSCLNRAFAEKYDDIKSSITF